jgi:hypothetical protein
LTKVINLNKDEKIEVIIRDDEIQIEGLELKPFWKRVLLCLFWWKEPKFIIRNPKIFYNRQSKGEMIALFG